MGKTTLVNSIIGVTRYFSGTIRLDGRDITRLRADQRAHAGVGWVPQERNIFKSLTVEENLTAVAQPGPWTTAKVFAMFPRLAERRRNLGNQLSGGEQQMLAVGRALILNPRIILLDEPLEGLAPIIVEELLAALQRIIREEGLSAILVEQNAKKILGVTDRAAIIERGGIVHQADSAVFAADRAILEKYLGVADSDRLKRGKGRSSSACVAPASLAARGLRGLRPLREQILLQRQRLTLRVRRRHFRAGQRRGLLEPAPRRRQTPQVACCRRHVVAHRLVVDVDDLHRRQQQFEPVPVGIAQIDIVRVPVAMAPRPMLDALAEAEIAGAIERPHHVMHLGHDVAEVVEAWPGARRNTMSCGLSFRCMKMPMIRSDGAR